MTRANCPSCGAEVVFALGSSAVVVCSSCRSVVARTDRAVEDLGKVAALVDTDSALHVGQQGRYKGKSFRLTGRAQIRHAAGGLWDEWYAAFDDGRWGWLAEARGIYYMTFETGTKEPLPDFTQIDVGSRVALPSAGGVFVVGELGEATLLGAEGEIPWRLTPNETYEYADLSGAGDRFVTLDYSGDAPLLFAGEEVSLASLGIKFDDSRRREKTVLAASLPCPNCAGPLELKAPDKAERVVCPYCDSMLDVENGNLKFLRTIKHMAGPRIPLGSKGTVQGIEFVVIGFMVRSVKYDKKYFWEEYLLYNRNAGFRWLVRGDHHWNFVGPLKNGEIDDAQPLMKGSAIRWNGKSFRPYSDGIATVEYVLGEFYWKVEVGEKVRTADYVNPPVVISKEISVQEHANTREITYSHGVYVEPRKIEETFGVTDLERPIGIAANQPYPHTGILKTWGLSVAALVVVGILLAAFAPRKTVLANKFDLQPEVPGQNARTFVSQPFHLDGGRNLAIAAQTTVMNSWVFVDGVLYDTKSGARWEFAMPVEYYFGSDSDGSWSEGSQNKSMYLSSLPAGDYTLTLDVQWQEGTSPAFELRVRQGVPHILHFVLALVALSIIPIFVFFHRLNFEQKRWEDSDFS
ncbi:MAG: DUF4178 domain-containing protein [Thermoanaerobaculia bacterium]|nr:DUF4178 domain-containing protein [Thermoanaerobaculia bacterium]